jgi:hypothetical protein
LITAFIFITLLVVFNLFKNSINLVTIFRSGLVYEATGNQALPSPGDGEAVGCCFKFPLLLLWTAKKAFSLHFDSERRMLFDFSHHFGFLEMSFHTPHVSQKTSITNLL